MIVPMRHLDLICVAAERESTLKGLRALGAVHLDLVGASGAEFAAVRGEIADAEKAVRLIRKAKSVMSESPNEPRPRSVAEVLAIAADRETLKGEGDRLRAEIKTYEPYGDFDPELARRLLDRGIDLAAVAELPAKLPPMRLGRLREKLARVENRLGIDEAKLAGVDEAPILRLHPGLRDRLEFAAAKEAMSERGAVAVVSGWVPESKVEALRGEAASSGWGLLLRAPAEGETPPTLIEPPRFFRPVKALFDGLGISPAYVEADVSVPFLGYFSLFFAMLVGDGAYGAIFLAGTLWGWRKYLALGERARAGAVLMRSWLVLLTIFSLATIGWGVLSNTWFGAGIPWCRGWPTVRWLADPSYGHMMLLCFTIGVSHLMLARVWNGVCKLNDSTALAEFGWAGVLLFMYFVTNSIVGIFSGIPTAMYWVFGVSLALVFGFTVKPSEFKTRGAELGMLPLNVMSALGDIISYVRLFAVGLASVKVAENFNSMATGLVAGADEWWLKALLSVGMVLILVVGHALNLAMAGLSILVHAVRLNTLEFSNHKGISWSGYAFNPFKKTKE